MDSQIDYTLLSLSAEQFYRLNFEEDREDHWSDIDGKVRLFKLDEGLYQQWVPDEHDNQVTIGIALKTVADLMKRYNSLTGYELKYWDKEYPQTGQ